MPPKDHHEAKEVDNKTEDEGPPQAQWQAREDFLIAIREVALLP